MGKSKEKTRGEARGETRGGRHRRIPEGNIYQRRKTEGEPEGEEGEKEEGQE